MNIVVITQNDPFYLSKNLDYLIRNFPKNCNFSAVVLLNPSPFGKKLSLIQKALETFNVFGLKFLIFYSFQLFKSKLQNKDVKKVLNKYKIPIINLESSIYSSVSLDKISKFNPDLLVSIAGNEIFKNPLIYLAPKGCINLHTSLLPKYRGLMPSFWVLKNQEEKTGVSVFFVNEGIDTGPILVQSEILIKNMTHRELILESKKLGIKAIIKAIQIIKSGKAKPLPNDDCKMSYYSFPSKEDVEEFRKTGAKFF